MDSEPAVTVVVALRVVFRRYIEAKCEGGGCEPVTIAVAGLAQQLQLVLALFVSWTLVLICNERVTESAVCTLKQEADVRHDVHSEAGAEPPVQGGSLGMKFR